MQKQCITLISLLLLLTASLLPAQQLPGFPVREPVRWHEGLPYPDTTALRQARIRKINIYVQPLIIPAGYPARHSTGRSDNPDTGKRPPKQSVQDQSASNQQQPAPSSPKGPASKQQQPVPTTTTPSDSKQQQPDPPTSKGPASKQQQSVPSTTTPSGSKQQQPDPSSFKGPASKQQQPVPTTTTPSDSKQQQPDPSSSKRGTSKPSPQKKSASEQPSSKHSNPNQSASKRKSPEQPSSKASPSNQSRPITPAPTEELRLHAILEFNRRGQETSIEYQDDQLSHRETFQYNSAGQRTSHRSIQWTTAGPQTSGDSIHYNPQTGTPDTLWQPSTLRYTRGQRSWPVIPFQELQYDTKGRPVQAANWHQGSLERPDDLVRTGYQNWQYLHDLQGHVTTVQQENYFYGKGDTLLLTREITWRLDSTSSPQQWDLKDYSRNTTHQRQYHYDPQHRIQSQQHNLNGLPRKTIHYQYPDDSPLFNRVKVIRPQGESQLIYIEYYYE